MSKFPKFDHAELLGITPLLGVQDEEIWNDLLTPQVKAYLGPITKLGEAQLMDTIKGRFPGDAASNLNQHVLNGSAERVRFPYLSTLHKTENGAVVIKRDGVKIKVMAWVGDVLSGKGELVFVGALRDRRFDGTPRANDSALLTFPYDDPVYHRQIAPSLRCAEVSIYSFTPSSRVRDVTGEPEFDAFIENPFRFLDRPQLFVTYFNRAWKTNRAPGQYAAPMPDVSKLALAGFERIARRHRYDVLEAAVSHYHVALWFKARGGYNFSFEKDLANMTALGECIKRVRESGVKLTRQQESWLCVVQSLRPTELIPEGLFFDGPIWTQDNIGPESLWMNKPLTARAEKLLAQPIQS